MDKKPKPGYKLVKSHFGKYEEIPESWNISNIEKIADRKPNSIKRGPWGSSLKKEFFVLEGYKVYEQQNAIYNDFQRGNYFIDDEKFEELSDFAVNPGDFIVSCSGTMGKISMAPSSAQRGVINQALLKISINDKKIESKYFWYLFQTEPVQKLFTGLTHGSAIKNVVSIRQLKEIPIILPPIQEQQKIASILSNVDDLITKYDSIIESTKKLKQGLMQQLLTKGIGHTKFKKVKWFFGKEIEIPEEWKIIPIHDTEIKIIDGDRGNEYPMENDFLTSGYCLFLSAKNVTKNGFLFDECSFISKQKDEKLRKGRLVRGDIVITTRGTLGNITHFDQHVPYDVIRINSGMAILRNNEESISQKFLYYLLKSSQIIKQTCSMSFGSAQPQLTIGIINAFKMSIPSLQEQEKITSILSTVDSKITDLQSQKSTLEKLKKGLMQKLLTGQIRVKV